VLFNSHVFIFCFLPLVLLAGLGGLALYFLIASS